MLYRQINASQVKCNFCLQWMSLSIDMKFHINVCDSCLSKGCQDKTLKAVSSTGELYQLYIVKQNSAIGLPSQHKTIQNWFQDHEQEKCCENYQMNDKTQLLEEIDQARNSEIKDIMAKWNILSSFLNEKDSFSKDEIKFMKSLISQRATDLKKLNGQFTSQNIPSNIQSIQSPFNFQIQQQQVTFDDQIKVLSSYSKNDFPQINIKILDKQNLPLKSKNSKKNKQNGLKLQEKSNYKSPSKIALKQKDLNCLHVSLTKLPNLKESNFTPGKRLNSPFFDDNSSLGSSCIKSSVLNELNSSRSSFRSSLFNSVSKRLNSEQHKKLQQTKSKILKFLQKNYESQSLARLMFNLVFEAYESTSIVGKSLQLISYNLSYTDFRCYLESFDWTGIEVLKLVKTKLCDDQLKILIDFITFNNLQIKVLVLTSNKLTQASIEYLYEYDLSSIKQIYLGKNRMMKGKVRAKISSLQNKYSLYL